MENGPNILGSSTADNSDNRERLLDIWLGLTGQAPLPKGPLVLPILSGSMRPAIPLGSRIRIKAGDATSCRVGDVGVYLDGNRLVAHRILWFFGPRKSGWVFLKGDANPTGHWVRTSFVKGLVREVMPAEDIAGAFPGKDPFSPEEARESRRRCLRDLLLVGPRLVKNLITGRNRRNGGDQ